MPGETPAERKANVVAEMMNWEQRCKTEMDLQTQWGEVWGEIFARGEMGEGGSGTIEQQIAAKERELKQVEREIREFDAQMKEQMNLVANAESRISSKQHRMKKNTELTPAL
jgi:hypothetical protein